jgi:hypothetical protein
VEIDNGLVENTIRPTSLGKKNWLFFGSVEARQRSAVMHTLIQNCRLHGVDPTSISKRSWSACPGRPIRKWPTHPGELAERGGSPPLADCNNSGASLAVKSGIMPTHPGRWRMRA